MGRPPKTRSYGIGTVYRDGNFFAVRLPASMGGGKKRFKTEAEAKKWQKEQLKATQREARLNTPSVTVQEYLSQWLETRIGIEPTTRYHYTLFFKNHVYPCIGKVPLGMLGPSHGASLIASLMEKGLNPNSVRGYIKNLDKALNDAVRRKLIAANPLKMVEMPKMKKSLLILPPKEEIQRMIDVARKTKHPYVDTFVILALTTGMRRGEILGLHWKHIDLEKKELRVCHSVQVIAGKLRLSVPKTESGLRTIPLTDIAIEALHKQRAKVRAQKMRSEDQWQEQDLVFSNRQGGMVFPNALQKAFKLWLRRHGFPLINVHMMRHIAASYLLSEGVSINVVQSILGHSSPIITMTVYGHTSPQLQREAVQHFDRLYGTR